MNEKTGISPAALKALGEGDDENFVAASTPGGIEAQEARGQQAFSQSSTLPKEMGYNASREKLEQIGFVFGKDYDDIFINVTFPEGWSIKPTEHSMHSDLLDNKGRARGSVFYKAAFYDRRAYVGLNRRFSVHSHPEDNFKSDIDYKERADGNWYGAVLDCGEVVFKTEGIKGATYPQRDELQEKAKAWLIENYPDHENVMAYWD